MPRFISRTYYVEACQWNRNVASLPISFAENLIPSRAGMACSVRCGNELRTCNLTDWLVRVMEGKIEVLSNGAMDQRFEQVHIEPVGADYQGITATFIGNPGADPVTEPAYIDWFNTRFPRGKAIPLRHLSVSDIEKIRLNSHFVVKNGPGEDEPLPVPVVEVDLVLTEPVSELEPAPAVAMSQTGTLHLSKKGR